MDIDQYFKNHAELTARALSDRSTDKLFVPDWRFYVAGLVCVAVATAAELWASSTHSDAGFFARTSTFLEFVLLAGIWLLTIAQAAHFLLARVVVRSRDSVREKTLAQLLKIDNALAHKVLQRLP